jgi:hypothetical protein
VADVVIFNILIPCTVNATGMLDRREPASVAGLAHARVMPRQCCGRQRKVRA